MRILPLLFYILDKEIYERFEMTAKVSSITHGHIRSIIACFYYLEFARQILEGKEKFEIYKYLQSEVSDFLTDIEIDPDEISKFDRLLETTLPYFPKRRFKAAVM